MRETRSSGSVEGVMGNHGSYSDSLSCRALTTSPWGCHRDHAFEDQPLRGGGRASAPATPLTKQMLCLRRSLLRPAAENLIDHAERSDRIDAGNVAIGLSVLTMENTGAQSASSR